jgi:thiaminase/transcriptional activator TenA
MLTRLRRPASTLSKVQHPRFSDALWDALRYPLEKMRKHPFVKGVRDGTVDERTMRFYLEQDFIYVIHYGRAIKMLSARVPAERAAQHLTAIAAALDPTRLGQDTDSAFSIAGLKWSNLKSVEQAPYTRLYTDHLLATACLDPYPSALAALLPCPMTYQRLFGEPDLDGSPRPVMRSTPTSVQAQLCRAWVAHYGSPGYKRSVSKWETIIDEVAADASPTEQEAMLREFDLATRMEYLFWDMASGRLDSWGLYDEKQKALALAAKST